MIKIRDYNENTCLIKILEVNFHEELFTDYTMKILWKWKFTGFDLDDLKKTDKTNIYFTYDNKRYILNIDFKEGSYFYFNVNSGKRTSDHTILFNELELCLDF